MIRVVRPAGWDHNTQRVEDRGEFFVDISPSSADHAVIAMPVINNPGLFSLYTVRCSDIYLRLRTPIPLFDPSHMGGRDAATIAARAASTTTEELTNEPASRDPAICGG